MVLIPFSMARLGMVECERRRERPEGTTSAVMNLNTINTRRAPVLWKYFLTGFLVMVNWMPESAWVWSIEGGVDEVGRRGSPTKSSRRLQNSWSRSKKDRRRTGKERTERSNNRRELAKPRSQLG